MSCSQDKVPVKNWVIPQGSDWKKVFKIKTGGNVVDITGSTFEGQIRKHANSATIAAEFVFTKNEATDEVTVILANAAANLSLGKTSTDPESIYVYDFKWTDAGSEKQMIMRGQINFIPAATRSA